MINNTSSSPYYSLSTFSLYVPLSVVYSLVANLYVHFLSPCSWRAEPMLPSTPLPAVQQQQQQQQQQQKSARIAIVTGSNTGIGFETARALAVDHGYTVILACRSRCKGDAAVARINQQQQEKSKGKAIFFQPIDLSSLESVRRFCRALESSALLSKEQQKIQVLVNNAGRNTNDDQPTADGLNVLFQSNFVGHYVLTRELLERKLLAPQARIVNLSSVMHHFGTSEAADLERPEFWIQTAQQASAMTYSLSKLAAILFTIELNRRYADRIEAVAVNPGSVNSDIWRDMPRFVVSIFRLVYLNNRQGCQTSVAAAVTSSLRQHHSTTPLAPYIQPYWLPSWCSSKGGTHWPVPEMLGPFSPCWATPRVPAADGGIAAARALWHACEELTKRQLT